MRTRLRVTTLMLLVVLLTGCAGLDIEFHLDPGPGVAGASDTGTAAAPTATGDAADVLATLEVKGRAPRTGYERDEFGQRWADVDRDGCDQRNQVLARDLSEVAYRSERSCVVVSGALLDPYTGDGVPFVRGEDTSADVQIDHVVALSNAWQTGAQQLSPEVRERFANDPLNLLAVQGAANMSKGDGDAATWLPPDRGFRCEYVARQVAVKAKYTLWVTPPEAEAIDRILADCPGQPLPVDDTAVPAA